MSTLTYFSSSSNSGIMFPKKTVCSGCPLFTSGNHHEKEKLVLFTTWDLRTRGDRGKLYRHKPNDTSKNNQDYSGDFPEVKITLEAEMNNVSSEKFIRTLYDRCRGYSFSLKGMGR